MDKDVLKQGVFFTLQEPQHVSNPYPFYRRLRSEAPIHWDFALPGWFLTRYADVSAALADPRLTTKNFSFNVSQFSPELQKQLAALGRLKKKEALYNDAPEHGRLRRPLNRAFHPGVFERLRPDIEGRADGLLAKAERVGSMNVVRDYSDPLAYYMMSELLGLPATDRAKFLQWCERLRKFMSGRRMSRATALNAKAAVKSFEAICAYIRDMIAVRRENFADDVIGHALAVEENETAPTEDEILANCVFFLHAGARNMSASISNSVAALLAHPEQFALLRDEPQALAAAVEELLRYDTPVQVAIRGVEKVLEFGGRDIKPGQLLVLLLGAANRDPAQFSDPDELDFTRKPNRHISFGIGPHGCIGAWLARFGLTIALRAILSRETHLRLKPGKLQWNPPAVRRSLRSLPVIVNGRPLNRRTSRPRKLSALAPGRSVHKPVAPRL
jgi:pimeloyl-[acyl-carrier protein] synthase